MIKNWYVYLFVYVLEEDSLVYIIKQLPTINIFSFSFETEIYHISHLKF